MEPYFYSTSMSSWKWEEQRHRQLFPKADIVYSITYKNSIAYAPKHFSLYVRILYWNEIDKGKGKGHLEQATKAQKESRHISLPFL